MKWLLAGSIVLGIFAGFKSPKKEVPELNRNFQEFRRSIKEHPENFQPVRVYLVNGTIHIVPAEEG